MTKRDDVEEALAEMRPVSFSPKMIYLGLAMVVLLLANAFLASQKNRLQSELDRKDEQILRLKTELSAIQSTQEADASDSFPL